MAARWCPELARSIDHNTDDEDARDPDDSNTCGPFHPAVMVSGCRKAVWKWWCPQHRRRKKRGTNIKKFDVWNALDEGLAELRTHHKAVGVNDRMVQPFQKNKSASHHDNPDGGADEHFRSKRS